MRRRQPGHRRQGQSLLLRDVLVVGLIWGASVVLQRMAVAEIEPLPLVALRMAAALLFFLPFVPRVRRGLAASPRLLLDLTIIGALNPVATGVLSALALRFASSGVVAVLVSLSPLFTALLARLLLDEPRLARAQVAGLATAFGGAVLLIATRSSGLATAQSDDLSGQALALAVALLMALATIYARRRLGGTDPLAASAGQIGAGLLVVGPLAIGLGEPIAPAAISGQSWLAVLLSGAIGLSASFILFLGMLRRHGPTGALLPLYVMPVTAAALGVLFLGETVNLPLVGGAALVLGGVFLFSRG